MLTFGRRARTRRGHLRKVWKSGLSSGCLSASIVPPNFGPASVENDMSGPDEDNHSDQLNPNNDAYWESRGYDERPDDWEDQADD